MCWDLCGLEYFLRSSSFQTEGSQNASARSVVTASYDVFLAHSGRQKDFVEQLYEDMTRHGIKVFLDKKSLEKGKEFPEHLLKVASTSTIAVPVLSEDFFMASSWPMAEIIASVNAKKPTIYPLFYTISSETVKNAEKVTEWSARWESWGMQRHNLGVEQWKETLKKIGITYGEERNPYMSEVEYRKRVVDCISRMLKTRNETIVSGTRGETSRSRSFSGSFSGSYSGDGRSEVAQTSIVVASSGSGMRQCWERFEVGVPIGLGVGVGQGVAALVIHAIAGAASAAGGDGGGNLRGTLGGSSSGIIPLLSLARCSSCNAPLQGHASGKCKDCTDRKCLVCRAPLQKSSSYGGYCTKCYPRCKRCRRPLRGRERKICLGCIHMMH